jgi:hypothetical protein
MKKAVEQGVDIMAALRVSKKVTPQFPVKYELRPRK